MRQGQTRLPLNGAVCQPLTRHLHKGVSAQMAALVMTAGQRHRVERSVNFGIVVEVDKYIAPL